MKFPKALLALEGNHATIIFGSPDDLKLKSSMTLFGALPGTDLVFARVLAKYFNGIQDWGTLNLLKPGQSVAKIKTLPNSFDFNCENHSSLTAQIH